MARISCIVSLMLMLCFCFCFFSCTQIIKRECGKKSYHNEFYFFFIIVVVVFRSKVEHEFVVVVIVVDYESLLFVIIRLSLFEFICQKELIEFFVNWIKFFGIWVWNSLNPIWGQQRIEKRAISLPHTCTHLNNQVDTSGLHSIFFYLDHVDHHHMNHN